MSYDCVTPKQTNNCTHNLYRSFTLHWKILIYPHLSYNLSNVSCSISNKRGSHIMRFVHHLSPPLRQDAVKCIQSMFHDLFSVPCPHL